MIYFNNAVLTENILPSWSLFVRNLRYLWFNIQHLIRLVLSYGREAWTLTKKDEEALLIFEKNIFRGIYGPKYENEEWKSRMNRELEEMSEGENVVKWIKRQRISWLGHLERMEEDRIPKKSSLKSWKGREKGKTQEKMERGSRKRSSIAGNEKGERVGGR